MESSYWWTLRLVVSAAGLGIQPTDNSYTQLETKHTQGSRVSCLAQPIFGKGVQVLITGSPFTDAETLVRLTSPSGILATSWRTKATEEKFDTPSLAYPHESVYMPTNLVIYSHFLLQPRSINLNNFCAPAVVEPSYWWTLRLIVSAAGLGIQPTDKS